MTDAETRPPLRLLLVDDEALARLRLRRLVEEVVEPVARVVAEADSAAAAQACLGDSGGGIDAVLLDIGLPGPSGLALATALRRLPRPPAVVFVTAHGEHALEAFDLQALDYLTKPVRRERLQQALARVAQWLGAASAGAAAAAVAGPPGDTSVAAAAHAAAPAAPAVSPAPVLVLHERGRVLRLPHAEILSLRAEHKSVLVRTVGAQYVVDESLNDLEQRLGAGFLRVHRNALVALAAIRALELRPDPDEEGEGWAVRVGGGAGGAEEWLAVSRRQVASVKAALARGAASRL